MPTPSRAAISKICERFKIPAERFQPVSISTGSLIHDAIIDTFCRPKSEGLLWDKLKDAPYEIRFIGGFPFEIFFQLVEPDDKFWLIIEETDKDRYKYWYYDGYIKEIVRILKKLKRPGEIYLVSKQCSWLFCVSDSCALMATGEPMYQKLVDLGNSEKIFL